MKIYLNQNHLDDINTMKSKSEILELVSGELDNEIIKTIYIDDVDVSFKYFKENKIGLEKVEEIHFKTKKINNLINETIKEAHEYLPKLKNAIKESANLFRKKDYNNGSKLFNQAVDGLEWYLNILNSIIDLKEDETIEGIEELLKKFNMALNRAMISLNKEEYNDFADFLEVEIIEYLDKLQSYHQKLLEEN
ncbi:MAG: hypothetical protein ACOCUI_03440 [bacterium]